MAEAEIHQDRLLDGLPRRAATVAAGRVAIRSGTAAMTYGALDASVDGFAGALAGLRDGAVVGVAAAPHPAFPIAYYGAVRAGHVCAVVDPRLAADELRDVLELAGVELLVATAEMADPLRRARIELTHRIGVVYLDKPGDHGARTVANLAKARPGDPGARRPDPDAVACLRFGDGELVALTHRDLTRGAARAARTFGFGPDSTVVNHLPAYDPVHLDAAVSATATQVLCADPDPAGGLTVAGQVGATHYFGQPAGLARLAADPRPTYAPVPTLRTIVAGDSVLDAARIAGARRHPEVAR